MMEERKLGLTVSLDGDFEAALERVVAVLQSEGFGILTEIDVKATLKKKLDQEFRPYRILGACNPPLAHQALSEVPEVGLLLPCNVTVEKLDSGQILVSFLDPEVMLSLIDEPVVASVAREAKARLERAARALAGA
jgi:uncharacterized protein (DUF302 family)